MKSFLFSFIYKRVPQQPHLILPRLFLVLRHARDITVIMMCATCKRVLQQPHRILPCLLLVLLCEQCSSHGEPQVIAKLAAHEHSKRRFHAEAEHIRTEIGMVLLNKREE